jgi:hypothetical protein
MIIRSRGGVGRLVDLQLVHLRCMCTKGSQNTDTSNVFYSDVRVH